MPVRPLSVRRRSAALVALAFGALTLGCASRAVPKHFPAGSAVSIEAPEARPATVTSALDAEPPLPGSETEHWPGLRSAESTSPAHAHGGHHGH